jgi:hypothetical protein
MFLGVQGTASAATVAPTSHDFGNQSVGTLSAPHPFTLSAYCTVPDPMDMTFCLGGESVPTSIGASGPFVVLDEDCPPMLGPPALYYLPATCTIRVAFQPTAPGAATGVLTTGGPSAELHGTGIPSSSTQPSNQFTFGKVKLNRTNGTATLTVKVPGPGTLSLGGKGLVAQRLAAARQATPGRIVSAAGKGEAADQAQGQG